MNYEPYVTPICDNGSCKIIKVIASSIDDAKNKMMKKYYKEDIDDTLEYDDFADELFDKYDINLGYPYTLDEL